MNGHLSSSTTDSILVWNTIFLGVGTHGTHVTLHNTQFELLGIAYSTRVFGTFRLQGSTGYLVLIGLLLCFLHVLHCCPHWRDAEAKFGASGGRSPRTSFLNRSRQGLVLGSCFKCLIRQYVAFLDHVRPFLRRRTSSFRGPNLRKLEGNTLECLPTTPTAL